MPKKNSRNGVGFRHANFIIYDMLYDNTDSEYFQPSSDGLNIQGLAEIAEHENCRRTFLPPYHCWEWGIREHYRSRLELRKN